MTRSASTPGRKPRKGEGFLPSRYQVELGQRLATVIRLLGGKVKAAAIAGRSRDQLLHYVRAESEMPFEPLVRLAVAAGIEIGWLATGRGQMISSDLVASEGRSMYHALGLAGAPYEPSTQAAQEPASEPAALVDDEALVRLHDRLAALYEEEGIPITRGELLRLAVGIYNDYLSGVEPDLIGELVDQVAEVAIRKVRKHLQRNRDELLRTRGR